MKNNATP